MEKHHSTRSHARRTSSTENKPNMLHNAAKHAPQTNHATQHIPNRMTNKNTTLFNARNTPLAQHCRTQNSYNVNSLSQWHLQCHNKNDVDSSLQKHFPLRFALLICCKIHSFADCRTNWLVADHSLGEVLRRKEEREKIKAMGILKGLFWDYAQLWSTSKFPM